MDYNTQEKQPDKLPTLIAVGLGSMSIGFWLTITIILAPIGIPLLILGAVMTMFGFFGFILKLFTKS